MQSILFLGSPDFAIPCLSALHSAEHVTLRGIISQPDRKKGRGKTLAPTPVSQFAIDQGIARHTPSTKDELVNLVAQYQPDVLVVVAFGMIIPKSITDAYLCLNIHPSLLPLYRGPAPIQAALLNSDAESGVCLMKLDEKMDEGAILSCHRDAILPEDNAGSLHDRYAAIGAKQCVQYLAASDAGTAPSGIPQDHRHASYCQKIQKDDLYLTESMTAREKYNRIRAFSPFPGAYVMHQGKRVKVLAAEFDGEKLVPVTVKPEGKGVMAYRDFCLGQGTLNL